MLDVTRARSAHARPRHYYYPEHDNSDNHEAHSGQTQALHVDCRR